MSDGRPPPQRERKLSVYHPCQGHMEDSVRHYKPTNRDIVPVSWRPSWFPDGPGNGYRLPQIQSATTAYGN